MHIYLFFTNFYKSDTRLMVGTYPFETAKTHCFPWALRYGGSDKDLVVLIGYFRELSSIVTQSYYYYLIFVEFSVNTSS